MYLTAEMRWFWRSSAPPKLEAWFYSVEPGGGGERVDVYLLDPTQSEVGIKSREAFAKENAEDGVEIKCLVARLHPIPSGPLAGRVELWTKCSSRVLRLDGLPTVSVAKTRWLRKFAVATGVVSEIELGPDEKPKIGKLPDVGCNVELTRLHIATDPEEWWSFGLEAFGPFAVVESCLGEAVDFLATKVPPVRSGHELSYPGWLASLARAD